MPCDTPPPPSPIEDFNEEGEEMVYEIIDDVDTFEIINIGTEDLDIGDYVDDAIKTFDNHKDPVFCCNFDNTGEYIVTGGQDDTSFVCNVLNKAVKFQCTGHSDSVIAANFSPDSKYVATADMNGLIQLWSMDDDAVIWDFEADEIQWLQWQKGENSLFAGSSDGSCWKWTLPDMDTNVFSNPNVSCCTGSISSDDEKLVTGYSDGTLKLWNIPNNMLLATLSGPSAHKETITTIKFNEDNTLLITGSEDGSAKVIKVSDFKVLWTINGCDSHEHETLSVEDVGFFHSLPYIVIGTNCGILSFWDLNTKTRRAHVEYNTAIIKTIPDKAAPTVYVALGDGTVISHDARTGDEIRKWRGHKASIFDAALSNDCRLLLTASEDTTCKIFQLNDL